MSIETGDSEEAIGGGTLGEWNAVRVVRGLLGTSGFLAVWWIASSFVEPSYLLPGPAAAAMAFIEQLTTTTMFTVPVVGSEISA